MPALKDIGVAKNYLSEDELKILNNLVSGYFDLAEINAIEHKPMKKAKEEYRKYQEMTLSPVEQAYMETIKDAGQSAKKGVRK